MLLLTFKNKLLFDVVSKLKFHIIRQSKKLHNNIAQSFFGINRKVLGKKNSDVTAPTLKMFIFKVVDWKYVLSRCPCKPCQQLPS
jgi:hypothetical protein